MSFGVSVYPSTNPSSRVPVFEAPVASDGVFFDFWHSLAVELELPLLSSVYHEGLSISGAQLAALRHELDALQQRWHSLTPQPNYREGLSLQQFLEQRASALLAALDKAEACSGDLVVG